MQTVEQIRAVRRLAEQRRRDIRRARGLCGHCGRKSESFYLCRRCRTLQNEHARKAA